MPNNFGGDQNDPAYNPTKSKTKPKPKAQAAPETKTHDEQLLEDVQRARKELRHRAHVYAHTKEGPKREAAGEILEQAALALSLAASLRGLYGKKEI